MTVLKVGFVGIRSDRLDETVALFRDVLGVSVNRQTDDLVAFKLADGPVLELYGPALPPATSFSCLLIRQSIR
jgi:catechol 2,3-dioxygenase-like lactoylglutathione lyase family enzyme